MKEIIKRNREIISYLIIGVLTTIVSLISYYLLTITILSPNNPLELTIANIISWIISVLFAYITNRKYVFQSKDKNILKEASKFTLSRVTTLIIDILLMFIFVSILHFNDKIIKLLVQIIIIILNYIFSKLLVFKKWFAFLQIQTILIK